MMVGKVQLVCLPSIHKITEDNNSKPHSKAKCRLSWIVDLVSHLTSKRESISVRFSVNLPQYKCTLTCMKRTAASCQPCQIQHTTYHDMQIFNNSILIPIWHTSFIRQVLKIAEWFVCFCFTCCPVVRQTWLWCCVGGT